MSQKETAKASQHSTSEPVAPELDEELDEELEDAQLEPVAGGADDSGSYNGNGQLSPNDNSQSPDSNNPGLNQSPDNRLTPTNSNWG